MNLAGLTAYAREKYHISEQHKWADFPGFSVLADPATGKWAALLMRQWDSEAGEQIERCDIKCGRSCLEEYRVPWLSGPFRMHGQKWVGVRFDEGTDSEIVCRLLDRALGNQNGLSGKRSGKESSGKDSSGKDSSGKDSSGKDSSGKDSSGKEAQEKTAQEAAICTFWAETLSHGKSVFPKAEPAEQTAERIQLLQILSPVRTVSRAEFPSGRGFPRHSMLKHRFLRRAHHLHIAKTHHPHIAIKSIIRIH